MPECEMDVAYRMTACRLTAGFFAAVRQAIATWRATRLHAAVLAAALALGCPLHAEESFLFPTEVVSAWSLGAVARPSTYVWADPISLGIPASGDPRIQAYLIGAITTQARFLNVQMLARPEHNFWIYTDRQFAADFLKGEGPQFFEAYGLPPEAAKVIFDRTVGIIAGASCAIYPIPSLTGQLKLLLAVNPYPFESVEFQDCAEIIMLQGFGANIRDQQFNRNAAYRFLVEIYATADRNNPFVSIPAVSKKALERYPSPLNRRASEGAGSLWRHLKIVACEHDTA